MWDLAAAAQLATAQAQLASANASVASGQTQLQAARTQLAQGQNQLSDSWNRLANGKTQLDAAREQLETSKTVLDKVGATLGKWEQTGITGKLYEQIRGKYDMAINQYNEACAEYNRQLNAYNAGLQQYQNAVARLDQGSQAYRSNADNLAQASKQIAEKQNELGKAVSQAGKQVADGVTQLIQGQRDIDKAETEYQSKLAEFNAQKPEAERQITLAEEKIDNLTVPAYSVSGRREGLTSQGYRVYMVIEGIVAKLADIFPIFLYFVAALVTFSTMGRMVDEERTNSGTLKALGYGNADVMLKFTVYGFAASTLGTCIGVLAGHTLLPLIVAHAYSAGFTMPDIMLKFHPWITMAAFALAWISAVVPAWLAVSKELREKPASLLLPKPPAKGSKILLEHFPPLWNRLNFTHKVTARNIFRYKTRMFMTIFGVCGAVSLLTAGLAVQSSIGQIGNRQFEGLIHYDLIVAEESDTNSAQREEIATTLKGKTVQSSTAVRYEELSKTAGKENDKQSITLLATDDAYNFNEYLTLRDRKTHQPQILVNNGAVISERLAEMLNVSVGDTFTVNDENGAQRTIKVAGISEMYIGHFIFMNAQCYEHVFGDQYSTNAYMVRLKDHSNANTERQGAKFMKLAAVRGVVQNTTQKNMVSTIVGSLNQIMEVLILVAVLLAVVILYDLTNLNVSERIRELSTIKVLGFHTSETTMYIYRETILLSLLGILAGYGFGEWLHRYIITEVPPDEVMFDPAISWIALAAPAIVVAVVLAVLGWIVYRQLETVDMLEALKSWNDPPRNGQRSSSPKARGTAATTSPATIGCPIALAGVLPACPYRCGRCHPRCSDPLAIAPASPCIYAAAAATSGTKAGSSDSMSSCCASNAPNTPANTSPEPAVAIQAGARPDRMIRVFPSPSAPTTMVTAPLSSTVAPVSSCARNAARNGRASTHCLETTSAISASNRFSNAANSPACGVITTCGTTWHGSKSNAPASTTMGGMPSARSFREPSPSSNA